MYHYTYLIKHKTNKLKYIGVRSCKCLPKEDTGYWGSSKYLPSDLTTTHKKRVLQVFKSRREALAHEIFLHEKYDVAKSPLFYNKARQLTAGFDTTGIKLTFTQEHKDKIALAKKGVKHTEEHRKNSSKAWKRIASEPGYVNPRQGVVMSDELKRKISLARKSSGKDAGIRNSTFKPWFITDGNVTYLFYDITKADKSLQDGYTKLTYNSLCTRSKGVRPINRGEHKGKILGNIPSKK